MSDGRAVGRPIVAEQESADVRHAIAAIAAAKAAGRNQRLVIMGEPNGSTPIGSLSAISLAELRESGLVELLTRWRAEHQRAFASRFNVTIEGTQRWLRDRVIGDPARVLFLIRDAADLPVGHVGMIMHTSPRSSAEVDAVLRGERAVAGTMASALRAMENWARTELGMADIWLRVLASNRRALHFYDRLGYAETGRQPLVSVECDGTTALVPGQGPIADEFVTMVRRSG